MKKMISAVFIVTGTSIGGGMILLPAIIGIYGYFSAISILAVSWLFTTTLALIYLEANCYLPKHTSMISITKKLLGSWASGFVWIACLGFLYTLLSIYITGLSELLCGFIEKNTHDLPLFYFAILAVFTMALPIYLGINSLNRINAMIVIAMFIAFLMLVFMIGPYTDMHQLIARKNLSPMMALPIVFTSFGFLAIIPSLRGFLDDNVKQLKMTIIVGSFIPLVIYILWTTLVMGVLPIGGEHGLHAIINDAQPLNHMTSSLIMFAGDSTISLFIQLFIFFAIASSFAGISLALYDFLADGLNITKTPLGKMKLLALTFLPPLMIVLMNTHLFIVALGLAGLVSTIVFGVFPVMLTWSGRYLHRLDSHYQVAAKKPVLLFMLMLCLLVIAIEIWSLNVVTY